MSAAALDAIVAHARSEAPRECCGLLLGTGRHVERTFPARNELASPTRYQIQPEDHFAAIREARDSGVAVIGAYHSHPRSAASPSATDLEGASYPEFVYLIVGFPPGTDPEIRAFSLASGNFVALELVRLT
ncbi:MAG TPA: M67 family metallopeptidase [Vicinamibacterales bacterium]|jgi:proteasome lid subunit RPN8/RPN11